MHLFDTAPVDDGLGDLMPGIWASFGYLSLVVLGLIQLVLDHLREHREELRAQAVEAEAADAGKNQLDQQ